MRHLIVAGPIVVFGALMTLGCRELGGPRDHAGATHRLPITASETWTLASSPHTVSGLLAVGDSAEGAGATLTIEAGVTVIFDDASGLIFGRSGAGSLQAQGTSSAPITMRGADTTAPPGAWIGLTFRGTNRSAMHHVTVTGCGRQPADGGPRGCLVLGSPSGGADPTLLVDTVTVRDASGGAVILQNQSRFAPGSSALSVINMRGHIATLPAGAAGGFPLGGTFTGNDTAQVRLTGDTLRESAAWAGAIPWVVLDPVLIEGPEAPVLTIPAGATLLMTGGFVVGKNATGGLQIGSEGGPTVNLRALGDAWAGVDFLANAVNSSISDAVLENCGRYNDTRHGSGCVWIAGDYGGGPAPAPVLKNVTIRNAIDVGVVLSGNGGRFGAGSTNLTITGTYGTGFWAGIPMAINSVSLSSLPPGHYTGNLRDFIFASQLDIRHDDTLHKLDVPYFVDAGVSVGDSVTSPTFTLDPGVIVVFPGGARFSVGLTAPGAVHAVGTAAEPITFTGETETPGAWVGIYVGYYALSSSLFDHVVVDYAGALDPWVAGAFHLYADIGAIIRNSAVRHSAACGIIIEGQPPWTTDLTDPALGNTFENNAGAAQCGP